MSSAELRTGAMVAEPSVFWQRFSKAYECPVLLCPEAEGGFSIHALTLPGAISQGETEQESLDNITEAILGIIEEHIARGNPIPWRPVDVDDVPKGAKTRWILVNA